ncbi:hypothetical protein THRCLA_23472 [Thraustotheca clavata]|uniref:Glutaredoxin domain-containing protein n=1 Tax=Thraustotheca clavata TaxID=74557 RepID=A0A1V9Y453_9STRA|nr:hypothetical protein THRCLA_23472 [Thraustotheca clavata]
MLAAAGCTKQTPTPVPTEDPTKVEAFITELTTKNGCVIFGEATCDYCKKTKDFFKKEKVTYEYIGVDDQSTSPKGIDVYNALIRMTKQNTLPNIWINSTFIGGYDTIQTLAKNNQLDQLLYDAGCFLW